jgi:hypothetical protein
MNPNSSCVALSHYSKMGSAMHELVTDLLIKYIGLPILLIDKVIYKQNSEFYKSKLFGYFQTGRASTLAILFLLSPVLVFSNKKTFLFIFIGIFVFSILFMDWLFKKTKMRGNDILIDEFVILHPLLSMVYVAAIFCALICLALACVAIQGPWK